ncbi:uncharacterized protein LOC133905242 [Phragmites australis]|uniref:uncharacterized protein LOC133905242 n=1 Tax=Phragmites australis TaxID=29695 RepID=UPI002D79C9BB|nr:uncharacterized protein LOC133905242 [Phragmites australis]
MEKGRRRRVPAFGEWNYYYYSGELSTPAASNEWYALAPEQDARSEAWFKYSPPPRKSPPMKVRRPDVDKSYRGGKRGLHHATPARASDAAPPTTAARTPVKAATTGVRLVRSVDADLYQVPPMDFVPDEPRRRKESRTRSQWMGCFGINCIHGIN